MAEVKFTRTARYPCPTCGMRVTVFPCVACAARASSERPYAATQSDTSADCRTTEDRRFAARIERHYHEAAERRAAEYGIEPD